MALSEQERRVVAAVEESWMSRAQLPTPRRIAELFGISEATASKLLLSEPVKEAFKSRGIPETEAAGLTPEQVTAINTVVNPIDTRSRRKKLQDMEISPTKWSGWMRSPKFSEYYRLRSTTLLQDAIPEAHQALVDNVVRGDFSSIKFLYEITGTYNSNQAGVDIPALLNRIFEIISIYITDPETLMAIANDLKGIASPGTITDKAPVQGELVPPPVAPVISEGANFSL